MTDESKESFLKLDLYIKSVDELAEGMERDIKNGSTISSDTVLRLSKMIAARQAVAYLIDVFEETGGGYQ